MHLLRTCRFVRLALRGAALLALFSVAACGGGKNFPKTYPVKGKVLINGQPAPDCVHPGPQLVLPTPSTTELPNGTTVPRNAELRTSTALTTYVEPTVAVKAAPGTSAVWSPDPGGAR